MTRTVSSATLAQAGAGVASPMYFVEIVWPTFSSRLCTYDTGINWNGNDWAGGGIEVAGFDGFSVPSRMVIADPDYTYRTLVFTEGLRDRTVRIWKGYVAALATDDPVEVFAGVAEGVRISGGRVEVALGRTRSTFDRTPRARIAPAFGVNFTAPPGTKVNWFGGVLVLNSRNG